jgi:hypothetical protein
VIRETTETEATRQRVTVITYDVARRDITIVFLVSRYAERKKQHESQRVAMITALINKVLLTMAIPTPNDRAFPL